MAFRQAGGTPDVVTGVSVGLFRVLLLLLVPGHLRERWGEEMCATFRCRLDDARSRGGATACLTFWMRETGSLLVTAVEARLPSWPAHLPGATAADAVSRLGADLDPGLANPTPAASGGAALLVEDDARSFKVAWACALALHFALFLVVFPEGGQPLQQQVNGRFVVMQPLPPPPPARSTPVRKPIRAAAEKVPIPDPTPEAPEPVVGFVADLEPVAPDPTAAVTELVVPGLPDRPPVADQETVRAGFDVEEPHLVHRVKPDYPEIAVRARRQCTVVLEAIIGTTGAVSGVEVLRGCGLGLDEAAAEAVAQWRYTPTLVHGRPVAVLLNVVVSFELRR